MSMEDLAICIMEFYTTARGMLAADIISKSFTIDKLLATPLCPGKFMVLAGGEVSSIQSAYDNIKGELGDAILSEAFLSGLSREVIEAIGEEGFVQKEKGAIVVIEALHIPTAIVIADYIDDDSDMKLGFVKFTRGMGGKALVIASGTVGAVEEGVRGLKENMNMDDIVDFQIINGPHEGLWQYLI